MEFVRYFRACLKENTAAHETPTTDCRIQKTVALLHEALGALIREKPYDEITVHEILDRANVGRSTFYMHFRDKDDLLVSSIRDLLGSIKPPPQTPSSGKSYDRIIRFNLPIFEHIYQHRQHGPAMMGARGRIVVHDHLKKLCRNRLPTI